jgi:hypothetical protein
MLPVDGIVVWNSHAFNLTNEATTNEQFLNVYYAGASDRTWPVHGIFDARDIFVQNVPPFEKREYCRTFTLPKGARLFQLSSHTHKRGKLFRIWGPGITAGVRQRGRDQARRLRARARPVDLHHDQLQRSDGAQLRPADRASTATIRTSRRYKFCSRYDNGADVPLEVKRRSTSPTPPLFVAPAALASPRTRRVSTGRTRGEACNGDDHACDSAPGANDGSCDACSLRAVASRRRTRCSSSSGRTTWSRELPLSRGERRGAPGGSGTRPGERR